MANIFLTASRPQIGVGLQTYQWTVTSSGIYNAHCEALEVPPSGLVITVTNTTTSTVLYTSPTLSPTQMGFKFKQAFVASAGDVVVIAVTSSNPIDSQLNNVKVSVAMGRGA